MKTTNKKLDQTNRRGGGDVSGKNAAKKTPRGSSNVSRKSATKMPRGGGDVSGKSATKQR